MYLYNESKDPDKIVDMGESLKLNLCKENLSLAYAISVASQKGWDFSLLGQDEFGYDVCLEKLIQYYDSCGEYSTTGIAIKLQLKCTHKPNSISDEYVTFSLGKNQLEKYSDKKAENYSIILMVVPEKPEDWIELENIEGEQLKSTKLKYSCFYKEISIFGDYDFNALKKLSNSVIKFKKNNEQFDGQFLDNIERRMAEVIDRKIEEKILREINEADNG